MLDAVGGRGFHSEMRRARHGDLPEFCHASDRGPERAQRQDIAGAAQFKIRARRAAGGKGGGLTEFVPSPLLRANGSRECAPDDRLREAIHLPTKRKNGLLPPSLAELRRTSRR